MVQFWKYNNDGYKYFTDAVTGLKCRSGQRGKQKVDDAERVRGGFALAENVGWTNISSNDLQITGAQIWEGGENIGGVNYYIIKGEQTALGFDGVEDVDWVTIDAIPLSPLNDTFKYYVNPTGNDANTGLSDAQAWQTIAKVNASSFIPGDTIGFKKGDVWRETLIVPSSGDVNNPIELGAYGSGANPILAGTDLVSDWTPANPWQAVITPTITGADTAWANVNLRNIIAANSVTFNGTKIRLSFKATGGNAVLTGVSIGVMTTGDIFDSAPTRITFDGGSSSTTIANGTTKVSDEVIFTFDKTKRHGLHIFTTQQQYLSKGSIANGNRYWGGPVTDETMTLDYTGSSGPAAGYYHFDLLELYTTGIYNATIALITPNLVFKDDIRQTKGTSVAALNDHEWFFTGGVLSYRDDSGSPTGITATTRNYALTTNGKANIVIRPELNVKYGNYKRFQDNFLEHVGESITYNTIFEPSALVSDDGLRLDVWVTGAGGPGSYFYSTDGITFSTPVSPTGLSGTTCRHILKVGNTYYMYAGLNQLSIHLYTSTDRIHFTDQGGVIALGSAGSWDDVGLGNTFVWTEGTNWFMLYEANSGTAWTIGLATSSDGVTWNKYGSNPVIPDISGGGGVGNPEMPRVSNEVIKNNGNYYCYFHSWGGIYRAYSSDLITWTQEGKISNIMAMHGAPYIIYWDQCLAQFKGKSYLFWCPNNQLAIKHIDVGIDNRSLAEMLVLTP